MKKRFKKINAFWLVTYALLLAFLLVNIKYVVGVIGNVVDVFMPFIYGFILAYILSFPYNFLHNRCFSKIGTKRKKLAKIKKPLAMVLTYIFCFGVVAALGGILIPQLSKSISNLVAEIPVYAQNVKDFAEETVIMVRDRFGYDLYDVKTYKEVLNFFTGKDAQALVNNFISEAFPAAFSFAGVFTTGLYNWIIGIVVSIYMLASKEKLCKQAKALVIAFLPEKVSRFIIKVTNMSDAKCGKFIIGKIIDSAIIGLICFIGLTIFKFDYALLISVIVGVTNVIPFFGPFIGAIPCAFLLLLIDPIQCFWFIIFVIILQQFDGNFLGPKILGDTVGISGFWILFSVLIGGGLFGVMGMLLGVPVFAVIYTLVSEGVFNRLKKKIALAKQEDLALELETLENSSAINVNNSGSEFDSDKNNKNENKEEK